MTCRGCKHREIGCHSTCEDYKAYKAEIETKKRQKDEALAQHRQHMSYLKDIFRRK